MQDEDWITEWYFLSKFQQPRFVEMTSFISDYTLLSMVEALTKPAIDHNKSTSRKRKSILHNNF